MSKEVLITGNSECNNCQNVMNWSANIDEISNSKDYFRPEVKILGGFLRSRVAGIDLEVTVKCKQCGCINKFCNKHILN